MGPLVATRHLRGTNWLTPADEISLAPPKLRPLFIGPLRID